MTYEDDDEEFYKALIKRVEKFGLSLSQDKNRIIKFSRFEKDANYFEFLGFEFRWSTSRKGKDMIKRRTSRKKLLASLKRFTLWWWKCRNFRLNVITKFYNIEKPRISESY